MACQTTGVAGLTDELRLLLAERRYAILATHDPDEVIHLTPVWFMFDNDRFYFESFSGSHKIKNLRRNPAASVIVDARTPGTEQWVAAAGTVDIFSGQESAIINSAIRHRYLTPEALADQRVEPVFAAGDDVTIRLTPDKWRSWTAKGLDEALFGGILGATPERWFLPVET
jgi:PPOX class probable F420-dependent enzyme